MASEVTIGGDRPGAESESRLLRLAVSVLPAVVFAAVLYPMFGYTGRIFGWELFAPAVAALIVVSRLVYSGYQLRTTN